jgi:hypothetical protein
MPSDQLSDLATDRIAVKHATSSYTSDRCSAGLMWRKSCKTRYLFTYLRRAISCVVCILQRTAIAAERLTVMPSNEREAEREKERRRANSTAAS